MKRVANSSARLIVEPVDTGPPVDSAVVAFSRESRPAILQGSDQTLPYARFSIFAADPIDEYVFLSGAAGCPFRGLAHQLKRYPIVLDGNKSMPFAGGWIGYFTYEAGLSIEGVPCTARGDVDVPWAWFRLYDAAAIFDHVDERWYAVAVHWPELSGPRVRPANVRLANIRRLLNLARERDAAPPTAELAAGEPIPNMSHLDYLARVERAKRHIEAGDIYQVNLTQRFAAQHNIPLTDLYRRLRLASPSAHAAYLPWGSTAVLSASPELFLEVRNGHVVTRPIKGTRPRTGHAPIDAYHRRELSESMKDRAELNMIVDLLRNDLGRVCSFGSIRVKSAGDIEEHPTVFHRVATIEGNLCPEHDWADLLAAAFPGGSITGAPKIRAMQIIEDLEPTQRGVYCGSIGYVGLDGSLSLNIAIRTMVQSGGTAYVHAGGAIVADSVPEQEYDETMTKARAMFEALGCRPRAIAGIPEGVSAP